MRRGSPPKVRRGSGPKVRRGSAEGGALLLDTCRLLEVIRGSEPTVGAVADDGGVPAFGGRKTSFDLRCTGGSRFAEFWLALERPLFLPDEIWPTCLATPGEAGPIACKLRPDPGLFGFLIVDELDAEKNPHPGA